MDLWELVLFSMPAWPSISDKPRHRCADRVRRPCEPFGSPRIHGCICRYFNGIYKYLRAAKEGREKLHSHLVQPDSLGIALLAVASSGQLCTQARTAILVLPPGSFAPKVRPYTNRHAAFIMPLLQRPSAASPQGCHVNCIQDTCAGSLVAVCETASRALGS